MKARALKSGDRVGLISPGARPASAATVSYVVRVVEEMSYTPVLGQHVLACHGHTAGSDHQRLEDLNNFIDDDTIKAIFCITGGFGALPLLDRIDYDAISRNPKLFAGSDENAVLLLAVMQRCALPVVLAPNLDRVRSRQSFASFKQSVSSLEPRSIAARSQSLGETEITLAYSSFTGSASGILSGGNLSAINSLMGTPFEPPLDGVLLYIDDYDERWDILERWLTNLYLSGQLAKIAGAVCGDFAGCGAKGKPHVLAAEDILGERFRQLHKANLFGIPAGHTDNSESLPLGVRAELDTARGTVTIVEAAVE